MSYILRNLPPRFYIDFSVPVRTDGSALTNCCQPEDFPQYVAWLADYLHQAPIPLSTNQQSWLASKDRAPKEVIFECSDFFGYAIWELASLDWCFEEGGDHATYDAEMRKQWMESTDPEDRDEFPYEELSLEAFERLKREWQQEKAVGTEWHHADIPFRSLLAWALRQMDDQAERHREIEWFFDNLENNASK